MSEPPPPGHPTEPTPPEPTTPGPPPSEPPAAMPPPTEWSAPAVWTGPPPGEPPPRRRFDVGAGWSTALVLGGLSFVIMALLGQALAFAVYLEGGAGGRPSVSTFAKIGWMYFGAFHHVPVEVKASNIDLGAVPGLGNLPVNGVSVQLGVALGLGTLIAALLLFRSGRAVASRSGGTPLAGMLHGMKIAPIYAVLSLLVSLLIFFRLRIPTVATGELKIQSAPLQAFVFPLLIAAVAGGLGGLSSRRSALLDREPGGRRVVGALAGGWRMFWLAVLLAFVGLMVAGAVQPGSVVARLTPSTAGYYRAVFDQGPDEGTVILAHHALVLPNEAVWALVPSMGGCIGAGGAGFSVTLLCYWKYPTGVSGLDVNGGSNPLAPELPHLETTIAPIGYFLFLLVPILATILGGRHAARRGEARTIGEAAGIGALSGVIFAVLVAGAALVSSLTIGVSVGAGVFGGGTFAIGPQALVGGLLALAWGLAGGFLGGRLAGPSMPPSTPAPVVEATAEGQVTPRPPQADSTFGFGP